MSVDLNAYFTLLYIYYFKVNSSHTRMSGPPPYSYYPLNGQYQPPPLGQYYPQVSVILLLPGMNINPLALKGPIGGVVNSRTAPGNRA